MLLHFLPVFILVKKKINGVFIDILKINKLFILNYHCHCHYYSLFDLFLFGIKNELLSVVSQKTEDL